MLLTMAFHLQAQTMWDAITYSQNNYYGTARTLAVGNAVTAIGGDLGSVAINPAGGAVSNFSQFTFSTGLTTASSSSAFAPSYDSYDQSAVYTGDFRNSKTRMTVPNFGLNLCFETGERTGIKSWNFGFIINRSQTYTSIIGAGGSEGHTSITGAMAAAADGMPGDILGDSGMFDSNYGWNSICAYDGGLINYNSDTGTYFGSAETVTLNGSEYDYQVCGWLKQRIGTTTLGSKQDIIFNYGFNADDRFFLGASLNCPVINYKYSEYFNETVDDPADFPVTPEYWSTKSGAYVKGTPTNYLGSTYEYSYVSDVSGVNLKVGAIWLPSDGLRLGAAFQTPTAYSIHEKWYVAVASEFADAAQSVNSNSPTAETTYSFLAPYSANFGLAYTFGRSGLFSFDYELTDFSIMKYSEITDDEFYTYEDPFYRVNRLNQLFCGVQHAFRFGLEFRPLPYIALRGGINMVTSPERYYTDTDGYDVNASGYDACFNQYENGTYKLVQGSAKYYPDMLFSVSAGAGFISSGAFYADIAFRHTSLPEHYYQPYNTYLNHNVGGKNYDIVSPSVKSTLSLFDAVLTLGWRF